MDEYSRTGLTMVEYVASLTSFVHCLKLRRRNPTVLLALPATSAMWVDSKVLA